MILRRFWGCFSDVWSENAPPFERLMEIHSNLPILYYGFNSLVVTNIISIPVTCVTEKLKLRLLCFDIYAVCNILIKSGEKQDEDSVGGRRRTESLRLLASMNPSQTLKLRALAVSRWMCCKRYWQNFYIQGGPERMHTLTISNFKKTRVRIKEFCALLRIKFFSQQDDTKIVNFDEAVLILWPFFCGNVIFKICPSISKVKIYVPKIFHCLASPGKVFALAL